jgi:lysyl-tRNA synthetase class 2
MFAFIGAVRLARPSSPWARRFYRPGSRKLRRAHRRDLRWHGRASRARRWLADAVAGRPHLSPAVPEDPRPEV